jgi:membrane protein implicated in regulation of membrane protease activity
MNWPSIFLGCFVIGFSLSVLSLGMNAVHVHVHWHWPFGHHAPGAAGHGRAAAGPVNFLTATAFVAWFGGTGYLLTSNFGWLLAPALLGAVLAGLAGATIVFWIMAHVLWSPNENMQSVDYHMVGVLGHLSRPIRAGGIGELVYVQGGTRKSCGARSADSAAIEKGAEVVVTEYDGGIASVRRWSELVAANERGE